MRQMTLRGPSSAGSGDSPFFQCQKKYDTLCRRHNVVVVGVPPAGDGYSP
jgi:hypothetical protein